MSSSDALRSPIWAEAYSRMAMPTKRILAGADVSVGRRARSLRVRASLRSRAAVVSAPYVRVAFRRRGRAGVARRQVAGVMNVRVVDRASRLVERSEPQRDSRVTCVLRQEPDRFLPLAHRRGATRLVQEFERIRRHPHVPTIDKAARRDRVGPPGPRRQSRTHVRDATSDPQRRNRWANPGWSAHGVLGGCQLFEFGLQLRPQLLHARFRESGASGSDHRSGLYLVGACVGHAVILPGTEPQSRSAAQVGRDAASEDTPKGSIEDHQGGSVPEPPQVPDVGRRNR